MNTFGPFDFTAATAAALGDMARHGRTPLIQRLAAEELIRREAKRLLEAAAPKLFTACERVVTLVDGNSFYRSDLQLRAVADLARAAVAEAMGGS